VTAETELDAAQRATPIRLALQWRPQSQFAGYYMARQRGMYRAAGLDVEFLHAAPDVTSLQMLQEGRVDVATAFLSDGVIAAASLRDAVAANRSEGLLDASDSPEASAHREASQPVVVQPALVQVAQLVQRSNLMLVAWRDMGIDDMSDLDAKRVGTWQGAFSATFDAFFAAHGVNPVRVPQYGSIGLFLTRAVAACSAMHYNEYHRIWQAGIDPDRLTTFTMRDYGLDIPEDGLFARPEWLASNLEHARALRKATIQGWIYARAHPEETLDVVIAEARAAGVPTNRPLERWMLEHVLAAIFVSEEAPAAAGRLDRDAYARTSRTLQKAGLIASVPAFEDFAPLERETP
jgi:NitT/TauT family transport system substrate-binding protein